MGTARPTGPGEPPRAVEPAPGPPPEDGWSAGPTTRDAEPEAPTREGGRHRAQASGPLAFIRELPGLVLVALFLALLIKTFLVQAFFIPSQSMEPTLEVGDRVLVNKFIFAFREPRRGEIIVFENPQLDEPDRNPVAAVWHWVIEGLGVSTDPEKDFIKRVVALPGETIELNGGRLFIDGERVAERYLAQANRDLDDYGPFTVPSGHLFVMGDNRPNSQDSRRSLGPVPRGKVVGRAFIVIWPPSNFRWLPGG